MSKKPFLKKFLSKKEKKEVKDDQAVVKVLDAATKEQLEDVAERCLSYPLHRTIRFNGKLNGMHALLKLLKKIEKENFVLGDKDMRLLLRCSLHIFRYISQKAGREKLVRNWLDDAKLCCEKTISFITIEQIPVAVYYLLRFFNEEDRWHSCDLAIIVFKDFIQKMGEKYVQDVEEEILTIFLYHMSLFCPGTAIGPSLKMYPIPQDTAKARKILIKHNPLPAMSKILHAMLYGYNFKNMDYKAWTILDTLFSLYIGVVKTCEHVRTHPKQDHETKSIWREWDVTECAVLESLRDFLDNIVFYDMKCRAAKKSVSETTKKKKKHGKKSKSNIGDDALDKVLTFVLGHALDTEIPLTARNKLLDLLINATKAPIGRPNLSICLPQQLLNPIIQIAMSDDPGSTLRSHRLLHNLIDRHYLRAYFKTPRIFTEKLEECVIEYDPADWDYIKEYRKTLYSMFFWNFLSQASSRINLEAFYRTICLMLIEIPTLYLARDISELMVNIQDLVINNPDVPMRSTRITAWIHATAVSVLSLIVIIYDMSDLGDLVSEVVNRRSQVAPFLLPPLKTKYTVGDITDFQDDIFFSHTSVRRCFTLPMSK